MSDIIRKLKNYDYAYHNHGTSTISDEEYDRQKEKAYELKPNDPYFKSVGAVPVGHKKQELPFYMGSMDKIKDKDIPRFKQQYRVPDQYMISDKLDGVSGLVVYENERGKLFTRGNGYYGQDVTSILPHIQNIPLQNKNNIAIRGELILSKQNFAALRHLGANARNMVAGTINAKRPNLDILRRIEFVPYTVLKPDALSPEAQMKWLKEKGWKPVFHVVIPGNEITDITLLEWLKDRKQKSPYEIDGLIVAHNRHYPHEQGSNPKYAFAFKSSSLGSQENEAIVDVQYVEWNPTKDGLIKPVVVFDEIHLNGVKIRRATGFNAAFIEKQKIGPGAQLLITRSGDVIPYIKKVIKPAPYGQMPTQYAYVWNGNHIDIYIQDHQNNEDVALKNVQHFFQTIKVPGFSLSNVKKMYDADFTDPMEIMYAARLEDFQNILGSANGNKIYYAMVDKRQQVSCIDLMVATNIFGAGFGSKTFKLIAEQIPFDFRHIPTMEDLLRIDGISEITARQFLRGWEKFKLFLSRYPHVHCQQPSQKTTPVRSSELLAHEVVVFTGFRDKQLEEKTEQLGGRMNTSISRHVTLLVYKTADAASQKIQQALRIGTIKLMHVDDYIKMLYGK